MAFEESISLEETNKIRISLGLKPLTDDGAPADSADKEAEDNYTKRQQRETKERDTKRIHANIAKLKNKHELNAKLSGATLGDADEDGDSALKWIKKSKKKEKELAKKRQADLDDRDQEVQEYTERDLAGLKVSHDFEDMNEGDAHILTLKDSRILDDEEDELQNVEIAEDEKDKKRNDTKIKKPAYKGYDDDEFAPGAHGMKRAVLSKYDDVINGESHEVFRLGNNTFQSQAKLETKEQAGTAVNRTLMSLDYIKNQEISDYLQEGEVGFKKTKTKKKRPKGRVEELAKDDSLVVVKEEDKMDIEPIAPRVRDLNVNFVDDDDLQAALARARRSKVKKVKKLTPEEIAQRVAEEKAQEEAEAQAAAAAASAIRTEEDTDSGLVFDDTSEFVRSINYNPIVVIRTRPEPSSVQAEAVKEEDDNDDDSESDGEIKEEEENEDAVMMALEQAITFKDIEMTDEFKTEEPPVAGPEQSHSSGLAATLNIVRQQGHFANATPEQVERERVQRERDAWMARERTRAVVRDLIRQKGRGSNTQSGAAQGQQSREQQAREYENRQREQADLRETVDNYKNYKPDINIVYHDEFGRVLTPKEAWKALSHKFHGKGSGRAKTDKRLKRIADEKKREAMNSGDTPLSMNKAFQIRQEKAGQAHMVLSVGNKGAVPGVAEFLDTTQPLAKAGKTEKTKGKKKAAAGPGTGTPNPQSSIDMTGFVNPTPALTALPLSTTSTASVITSGAIISAPPTSSSSPAPTMKSSFSRITTTEAIPSGTSTPDTGRTKVAFGLKRKADDLGVASPAKKR